MRKIIMAAVSIAALAVPAVSMADAPAHPGGFGTERAANIQTYWTHDGLGTWGNPNSTSPYAGASDRAGNNSTDNHAWMQANGDLPVNSSVNS